MTRKGDEWKERGSSGMNKSRYLAMGVDKSEGTALAAKVDKRRSCLQVLRQTQRGGAGGEQSDRKEIHLSNCVNSPSFASTGWSRVS